MKVLITGHLGFVGSHFYQALLQEGGCVISTCDTATGPDDLPHHEPRDCREGFENDAWQDMDLVIHCAATIPSIAEREANALLVANDLSIDSAMFQWAMRNQPRQIVMFSSSAAYPESLQHCEHYLTERDLDLDDYGPPSQMYGLTKLVAELQAREAKKLGIDIRVFRPFSGYGSDQSLNYPFRAFVERARSRKAVFDIWGSGRQVRDFIHIDDIVEAVLTSIRQVDPGPLNLGTGIPTTMRELAELCVAAVPGYRPAFRVHDDKPEGSYFRCCDASMMRDFYIPKISLEDGIRRAMENNT